MMKLLSILGKDATEVEILPSKFSVFRSSIIGGTEGQLPITVRVHCIKMSSCKSYPWEFFHSVTSERVLSQTFIQNFMFFHYCTSYSV